MSQPHAPPPEPAPHRTQSTHHPDAPRHTSTSSPLSPLKILILKQQIARNHILDRSVRIHRPYRSERPPMQPRWPLLRKCSPMLRRPISLMRSQPIPWIARSKNPPPTNPVHLCDH